MKKGFFIALLFSASACMAQITTSEVKVENTNDVTSINGSLGVGTDSPNIWFQSPTRTIELKHDWPVLRLNSTNQLGTIAFTNSNGPSDHTGEFHISHEFPASNPSASVLAFFSFDPVEHYALALTSNGRVGIGLADPTEMLHVNGTVRANTYSAVTPPWSDFVFEDDYELMKLEKVESFIKENKHLPEIPSEKELQKSGLDLPSMDSKLLQKIEELTLYMIDMNKRVNELENENTELKEKVESLENE